MNKKNYIAIAEIIKDNSTTIEKADGTIMHVLTYGKTLQDLAQYFKSENPNFDIDRFTQACGQIN